MEVNTQINPEIRKRSIFKAILYQSESKISGHFGALDTSIFKNIPRENIRWSEAFLSFGLSDMRGIGNTIITKLNGAEFQMNPSIPTNQLFSEGVSMPVDLVDSNRAGLEFTTSLTIRGSQNLNFIPIGKETRVTVTSEWNSPSYDGAFLPEKKDSLEKGFKAYWKVLDLNRNFPQSWLMDRIDNGVSSETKFESTSGFYPQFANTAFGVRLIETVDEYQKNERSVKYAVLFIFLTFLLFFFVEISQKQSLHALQYLLIGAAVCIFYVLLISLSEHIGFDSAYLIALIAIVTLISAYIKGITGKFKLAMVIGGMLSLLYIFLYFILLSEDNALLIGSVGLFLILATVMYYSRNLNTISK